MVPLHPEPAPSHAARLGATLLGRMVLVRGAAAHRSQWPQRGAHSGGGGRRSLNWGGRDRPLEECGGAGHAEGLSELLVPQRPRADGNWAPCGRRLRGGGAATPPLPLPPSLDPIGLSPPPKTGRPAQACSNPRRGPHRFPRARPPRPHAPAPSLTHLASTGTWAIPGLGPR